MNGSCVQRQSIKTILIKNNNRTKITQSKPVLLYKYYNTYHMSHTQCQIINFAPRSKRNFAILPLHVFLTSVCRFVPRKFCRQLQQTIYTSVLGKPVSYRSLYEYKMLLQNPKNGHRIAVSYSSHYQSNKLTNASNCRYG